MAKNGTRAQTDFKSKKITKKQLETKLQIHNTNKDFSEHEKRSPIS